MKFQEWLESNVLCRDSITQFFKKIETANGLKISVQASKNHYCEPRVMTTANQYESFELGFPNRKIDDLVNYAEDKDKLTETVYPYVPVNLIQKIIDDNGGIK